MALYLIVLLTFLTHIGFAGSRVAVALFAVDLGANPLIVGTVVSLYAVIPVVLALPAGRITDRMGFKIPLVFGTGAVCAALLLPFLWPRLATLYFTTSLLGVGFMTFQIATQTLAGAIATPAGRSRNFNLVSLGFACGNFTGPLIAGILIDHIGHARTFSMLALPVVPAVLLSLLGSRWIPQVQGTGKAESGGAFDLLRIPPLRNALIASAIISSAWDLYQFFMPIYGRANGMSATSIGTILSAFAISIIVLRVVLQFVLRHFDEAQLLTYAMFVACVAYCLFPLFHSTWTLAAVSFILGLGCGCGQPLSLTLVYNASPAGRAGEAAGMRIMANQAIHLIVPLIFGALGSFAGLTAVFLTNAGCLVVGGAASLRSQSRPPARGA
jgi:MFS family permease